ncbi:phage recombination protein Bet [uncultured Enterovirga sp.]|uniref:phage recombination protein Bet n=1 Tax=uncultured Enterovirga sp. TaxID=2026352 RepID=UPI0035C9C647
MGALAILPTRSVAASHPLDDGRILGLIKRMYAPAATNDEFEVFIGLCRSLNLDPRKRQIYHMVYSPNDEQKRKVVIVVAIDGYRSIAFRTGDYLPGAKPAVFEVDETLVAPTNPEGLVKATVTVRKFFHGQVLDFEAEAYWKEYAPVTEENPDAFRWEETGETWPDTGRPKKRKVKIDGRDAGAVLDPKSMWAKMPRGQLAKVAEAKALRMGWPEEMAGVYVAEEMDRASAMDIAEQAAVAERTAQIGGPGIFIDWLDGSPVEKVPLGQISDRIMAFVAAIEKRPDADAEVIADWRNQNRAPLKEFWANLKGEALQIRNELDAAQARIAARATAGAA